MIKCIAFDCFGTVFDMSSVPREEIKAYADHVRQEMFNPYVYPISWWELPLHPDAAEGVRRLQEYGYHCATLSNGSAELIGCVSRRGGIKWDTIVDLVKHRVYKPHIDAYRKLEVDTGYKPEECMMVTANPRFGDLEGAAAIGMEAKVIRHGSLSTIIDLAVYMESADL